VFTEWVLQQICFTLIVRLSLHQSNSSQVGGEGVRAFLLGYHYDDDGSVVGHLDYNSDRVHKSKRLNVSVSETQSEWPKFVEARTRIWKSEWRVQSPHVFQLVVPAFGENRQSWEATPLVLANALVIQHLARMQGYLCGLPRSESAAENAFVGTAARRLDALIVRANQERIELRAELDQLHQQLR